MATRTKEQERIYRAEHLEACRAAARRYHARNREKVRKQVRAWVLANPERVAGYRKKRRTLVAGKEDLGWIDVRLISNYYSKICGICGLKIESKHEIDHIIPLSRNGNHTLENLQLTHPICNRTKSNHLQKDMLLDILILKELVSSKPTPQDTNTHSKQKELNLTIRKSHAQAKLE